MIKPIFSHCFTDGVFYKRANATIILRTWLAWYGYPATIACYLFFSFYAMNFWYKGNYDCKGEEKKIKRENNSASLCIVAEFVNVFV